MSNPNPDISPSDAMSARPHLIRGRVAVADDDDQQVLARSPQELRLGPHHSLQTRHDGELDLDDQAVVEPWWVRELGSGLGLGLRLEDWDGGW